MVSEHKKDFLINFLFYGAVFVLIAVVSRILFVYLFPFLIGGAVAAAVQRPANALHKKTGMRKSSWSVILTVVICAFVLAALALAVWAVGGRMLKYGEKIPEMLSGLQAAVKRTEESLAGKIKTGTAQKSGIEAAIESAVNSFLDKLTGYLSDLVAAAVKSLPYLIISSIVTVVASCYIAKDFDRLKKFVCGFVPQEKIKVLCELKTVLAGNCLKFIKGYGIIAAITFLVLCAAFFIIGIDKPVLKAFLVSLVDALPVLGVGTVIIPWAVIEFAGNNFYTGTGLVISYAAAVIIRNFTEPEIIGEQIGVNPVFTLIAMFLGLKIAGVAGVILFPLTLTVAYEYYKQKLSAEKAL